MSGWIKIHREIFNSDIWNDVSTFRLFIYLIGMSSHMDGLKYKGLILNKGQWVRSYRKLADDLSYKEGRGYKKYSISTIKSCVNKLIGCERVNVSETEHGTLFTIINYALYQGLLDGEIETPNTLNGEVRTNPELTPNEVRTNPEQDQELKNLRIKELKNTTATSARETFYLAHERVWKFQLNPFQAEQLGIYIDQDGVEESVVIRAIERAAEKGTGYRFSFITKILNDYLVSGAKTLQQAVALDETFENAKQSKQPRQTYSNRSGKPSIPMITASDDSMPPTAEEMRRMRDTARKMDGLPPLTDREWSEIGGAI